MQREQKQQKLQEPAEKNTRTSKLIGLFLAAALATGGCSSNQHSHYDKNGDGYCDEDGEPMNQSRSGGSHYYSSTTSPASTHTQPSGSISSGTPAPKGGIGSFSTGSGG